MYVLREMLEAIAMTVFPDILALLPHRVERAFVRAPETGPSNYRRLQGRGHHNYPV